MVVLEEKEVFYVSFLVVVGERDDVLIVLLKICFEKVDLIIRVVKDVFFDVDEVELVKVWVVLVGVEEKIKLLVDVNVIIINEWEGERFRLNVDKELL